MATVNKWVKQQCLFVKYELTVPLTDFVIKIKKVKGGRRMNHIRMAVVTCILMIFLAPSVTSSAAGCGGTVSQNTTAALQKIDYGNNATIAQLLVGLTYIERLYDFDMGEHNIRDVLLYEQKPYGASYDVLDWLIRIGGAGGDTLKISNNVNVFGGEKLFSYVTSPMTLGAFLEENRQKWIPDTPMNEWFLQESRAYILPLLTVSEDSVYVIVDCYIDRNIKKTDPVRYAKLRETFRQQLEQAAKQQSSFIDLWYRMAKPEKRGLLSSNRIVLDSLRIDPDTTIQWSDRDPLLRLKSTDRAGAGNVCP